MLDVGRLERRVAHRAVRLLHGPAFAPRRGCGQLFGSPCYYARRLRVIRTRPGMREDGGEHGQEGGGVPEAVDAGNLTERVAQLEAQLTELRNLTKNLDLVVVQRTRALAESEAQLRRKNLELDRLTRVRGEFIAIAAHEL